MSPAPLAPRSFLEVPVNSGGGVSWVVAEEGVPGKEGFGIGGWALRSLCFYAPPVHMCVVRGAYMCVR